MKRLVAALAVIVAQIGVLGVMVYEREDTLLTGDIVYLRTMPVDPRDPLRGDYVALDYEINRLPLSMAPASIRDAGVDAGTKVYLALDVDERGVAHASDLSLMMPSHGLFLRGRTVGHRDWRWAASPHQIAIKYGVEKYFVPQGTGLDIEQKRGQRTDWQTAMEVAVAVNSSGTAVIRDYRWSSVATKLEDLTVRPTEPEQIRVNDQSPHLRLSFRNDGEQPIALINNADNCGLSLESADGDTFDAMATVCANWPVENSDVITISPGEIHQIELKLETPRWHIRKGDFVGPMGKLQQWTRFRLVYRSPLATSLSDRIDNSLRSSVWSGVVRSPAFTNRGMVD